ncbi:unnamed protein product [Cyclocybe aegerita]|uniref:ACB domain-containing protein n=1 Tax=Cyclocybe aegerita TaxID=1973307 RepID=A0A8S0XDI0_CYCAE|nr:unnamed protein product [Cyclocybe aegerita]
MTTQYEPSAHFHSAAAYLSSALSLKQVSSSTKLELYGLFKHLTVAPKPDASRPSIFDMVGRAKWDAWDGAEKKYQIPKEAEKRYLEIARGLGWSEGSVVEKAKPAVSKTGEEGDIWDDEDSGKGSGGGGSLGLTVSTLAAPPSPQVADFSIHGLALSNDVFGLTALLDGEPEIDVNALDEFGYAPIHLACDRGHIDIVQILLRRGADRNIKDPDGLTPLELAQEAGRVEIEKILVSSP